MCNYNVSQLKHQTTLIYLPLIPALLSDYIHIFWRFAENLCTRKHNKVQTKRANITGIHFLRILQLVVSPLSFYYLSSLHLASSLLAPNLLFFSFNWRRYSFCCHNCDCMSVTPGGTPLKHCCQNCI